MAFRAIELRPDEGMIVEVKVRSSPASASGFPSPVVLCGNCVSNIRMKIIQILFVLSCGGGLADALAGEVHEYARGNVTQPFAYTATVATVPRPHNLDFAETHGLPDNCQAFVRIDGELWQFQSRFGISVSTPHARYSGPDIEHMTRREDSSFPDGYRLAWILGGLWYDEAENKLYAPMHVEAEGINRNGPVAPWPSRKIILATSTDKGRTWHDEGDIIEPETYFAISDTYKFAGPEYSNGLCDYGFYADIRGGYFYIFPNEAWLTKGQWTCRWTTRAARCAISDRMAPGKWKFFHNGRWDEPALGGKSSVVSARLWPIIYSTYLKRYVSIFPSNADPVRKDNVDGVYLGSCSDLEKQDWVFTRLPEAMFGFMNVLNAEGTDVTECGQQLRLYSYFNGNLYQRLDIAFGEGQTTGPGVKPRYTFAGHPESSDPIIGRRTKFIESGNKDARYAGAWAKRIAPESYEGKLMECRESGSVELSFTGSDIYWRALCSPRSGMADVFVNGVWRKSVDCFSPQSTDHEQIVYILKGLPAGVSHTIKVVTRGQKNPASEGAAISHIGFEYAAESYRASAGFSSLQGKENWRYLEQSDGTNREMRFDERTGIFSNFWVASDGGRIGPDYQRPAKRSLVRQWVAPHDGVVRIEGAVVAAAVSAGAAAVVRNGQRVWPLSGGSATHDFTLEVVQGDAIDFAVAGSVEWNPVITYLHTGRPAVWTANAPGESNLARGRYVRATRLSHEGPQPAAVADGSLETSFSVGEYDPRASGKEWLSIDLDRTCLIDRYVVVSVPPHAAWRPASLILQKSDDGFAWSDVDVVTENARDRIERAVPAFKARYVRFLFPRGKPYSVNELELYHTGGKPAPESTAGLTLR